MLKNWYILIVKPKYEIKIATKLTALNLEVYCPLVEEIRIWSDRKKKVNAPLFKSYVFVRLTEKERQSVFVAPGVVRYLFWLGKSAIVRDEEMDTLQKWLSNENVEDVTLTKFIPGEKLTIKNGILKDKNVIVQEVGKTRVRLVIQGLGVVLNMKLKDLIWLHEV